MSFQPGQSGNPGGRRKEKPFRDALRLEMIAAEKGQECQAPKGSLRWNARQLLELGTPRAIQELADRLDGKVPQAIVGDDEHDPIRVEDAGREIVYQRLDELRKRIASRNSGGTAGKRKPKDTR